MSSCPSVSIYLSIFAKGDGKGEGIKGEGEAQLAWREEGEKERGGERMKEA